MAKHKSPKLTRKVKAETERLKSAAAIYLEYTGNSSYAHERLRLGVAPLTPEAVAFMQSQIAQNKDSAAHAAEVKAQVEAEIKAARIADSEQLP